MKNKLFYLVLTGCLLTFAACENNDFEDALLTKSGSVLATLPDADTKTVIDGLQVLWSESDAISMFTATESHKGTITDGKGTKVATFGFESQVNDSKVAAVYPYYDVNAYDAQNAKISMTMPDSYTYVENGIGGAPMAALITDQDAPIAFKNAGALMGLTVNNIPVGYNKAILTSLGEEAVAGPCEITFDNAGNPTIKATTAATGKSVTISFEPSAEVTSKTFYFPIPVANYSSLQLAISDGTNTMVIKTKALNAQRSMRYKGTSVEVESADAAQAALDNAIKGTTIQLKPGVNYGTLVFRQNANKRVVDITNAGGDAAGNEKYSRYENITILGAPGAIVDQIDFQVGWIAGSGASYVDIKNLTVKDVTFSGEKIAFNMEGGKGSALGIDGLTIDNCTMNDANGNDRLVFQQISGYKELKDKTTNEYVMTAGVKNLTITNCEVSGAYMVIESRAMENLIITNNTFNGIKARDMLITSDTGNYPNETYTGEITITGNTSIGGEERFVRASLNNSDAVVTVSNNTISNYKGLDPDYIKVSGGNDVTIENNIYTVATTDNLQKLILNTIDNTVFLLETGDYGDLDFTHTYNGSKVQAKNIIIQGVSGTVMSSLVSPVGGNPITNWAIKNIQFTGRGVDIRSGGNMLTVENCKFANGANIYLNNNYEGITVEQCEFNGSTTGGVYLQGVVGVAIENCTFVNMPYNAIQLSGAGVSGNVNIVNNTISNCASRAMRIVTKSGTALNISNNTMTNSDNAADDNAADRGQIVKISGEVRTGTFENNTHNGKTVVFTDGIAKE